MQDLFYKLKQYYEKFLQRGLSYGLLPQEIHENTLNLFVKFLSLFFLSPWNNKSTDNNSSMINPRNVRMYINKLLFQSNSNRLIENLNYFSPILNQLISVSHIEIQLKDALSIGEWEELIELLLSKKFILKENFRNSFSSDTLITPDFLSFFYESILNNYEKLFALRSVPKSSKRKKKGIFFTPWRIIRQISEKCIDTYFLKFSDEYLIEDPKFLILDPACGTGSFLVYIADYLYRKVSNFHLGNLLTPLNIIRHCIYGIDLFESSLTVVKFRLLFWLLEKKEKINEIPEYIFSNIKKGNSLFGNLRETYQYPLDYSIILSKIKSKMDQFELPDSEKVLKLEEWLYLSIKIKKLLNHANINLKDLEALLKAKEELNNLINYLYEFWLDEKIKKFPSYINLKIKDIKEINKFHYGLEFPEIIVRGGFDIIIGNPPYGRSVLSSKEKLLAKVIFRSCKGVSKKYSLNSASAFIERSIDLLKPKGLLGMIIPFSILRVEEFESLRIFLIDKTTVLRIHDESSAFRDVTLEMCSIFIQKQQRKDYDIIIKSRQNIKAVSKINISNFRKNRRFIIYHDELWDIVTKIGNQGVVSGDYGIDHRAVSKDLNEKFSQKYCVCFLHSGRSVLKYGLNPKYFQWSKVNPTNERFTKYFNEPRLINTAIGNKLRVAYKPEKIIPGTNVSILEIPSSVHYFPMLIILNSDLINYLLKRYILNFSNLTVYLHKYYTQDLPIIYPKDYEKEFTILSSYLVFLNQGYYNGSFKRNNRLDYIQNLANYLIYDLYFPEILDISSSFPSVLANTLKSIEINSFLDLDFIAGFKEELDQINLSDTISKNINTINQVTNNLRDNEEIIKYKKIIYNHKIVRQIRKEL